MSNARLAVAMDQTSREEFLRELQSFRDLPIVLKLGLRLLPLLPAEEIRQLGQEFSLFVDMKLHDIPTQVAEACQTWQSLGARYLTVHLSGGASMLQLASQAVDASRLHLAGVSVLTSMNAEALHQVGVQTPLGDQVMRLVKLGVESGVRTFVCSVHELSLLREHLPDSDDLEFITPGLVLEGQAGHADQARTATISRALEEGSDVLVVGRSILKATNPRAAAQSVLEQIAGAKA